MKKSSAVIIQTEFQHIFIIPHCFFVASGSWLLFSFPVPESVPIPSSAKCQMVLLCLGILCKLIHKLDTFILLLLSIVFLRFMDVVGYIVPFYLKYYIIYISVYHLSSYYSFGKILISAILNNVAMRINRKVFLWLYNSNIFR